MITCISKSSGMGDDAPGGEPCILAHFFHVCGRHGSQVDCP